MAELTEIGELTSKLDQLNQALQPRWYDFRINISTILFIAIFIGGVWLNLHDSVRDNQNHIEQNKAKIEELRADHNSLLQRFNNHVEAKGTTLWDGEIDGSDMLTAVRRP